MPYLNSETCYSLSSSTGISTEALSYLGHCDGSKSNQAGPVHQSSYSINCDWRMPQEAQSAGLSALTTWLHLSGGTRSTISDTQFLTYVLNLRGFPVNQFKTIVLLVQVYTSDKGTWETPFTWCSNLASTWTPQSSRRGTDSHLIGATFVLDMTSEMWTAPVESTIQRYTTPAYASSDASEKPCLKRHNLDILWKIAAGHALAH